MGQLSKSEVGHSETDGEIRKMGRLAVVGTLMLLFSVPTLANPDEPIYKMKVVVPPKDRVTIRWAFVVDTSSSIVEMGLFGGILKAYNTATQRPSDHLCFCMYAFNDRGCHTYKGWEDASVEAFDGSIAWLYDKKNQGTMSHGTAAIVAALKQKQKELTVIIISDGGFTEGGEKVKKAIKDTQAWREKVGLGAALICTIGIENHLCYPQYPKPSNETCQGWLSDIGKTGGGGYFYIYKREEKTEKEK